MPVSHVSLPTGPSHYKLMRQFYVDSLSTLGYTVYLEKDTEILGLGPKNAAPDFWLHCGNSRLQKFDGNLEKRGGKTHVAFEARSRKAVDEWYKAALQAGGVSNGEPGERPEYTSGYYAAYVIDPLGNNIEAMHWSPVWMKALLSVPYAVTGLVGAAVAFGVTKFYV